MTDVDTENTVSRQAEQAVREASEESDSLAEVRVHLDETMETKTPGFTRMRVEWNPHDAPIIENVRMVADSRILQLFSDAFVLMNEVYDLVREKETDENGEVVLDRHGFPVWAKNEAGAYIEDYNRLTRAEQEDLLFKITTRLFEWKQTAADLWGDAMFAKALWEEAMAVGFDAPQGRLTVEDRTQKGRLASRDERYHAIFRSVLSRRADAVCSTMELLGQRLKDFALG